MIAVTLQLDANTRAGDWATRHAGPSRTSTHRRQAGTAGGASPDARPASVDRHGWILQVSTIRGVLDSARRGPSADTLPATRTRRERITHGSPIGYRGMWFLLPR